MEDCTKNVEQRLSILNATLELVETTPFKNIKVADICSKTGISRSTFYRNFAGVAQIPVWYQNYTATSTIHKIGLSLTCRQGHLLSVKLLLHAEPLYRSLVNWWNNDFSLQCVNNHSAAIMDMLKERDVPITTRVIYEAKAQATVAHELVALWLNDSTRMPADQLVELIRECTPSDLLALFDTPPQPANMALLIDALL